MFIQGRTPTKIVGVQKGRPTSMGSPISSILAKIFVHHTEQQQILRNIKHTK